MAFFLIISSLTVPFSGLSKTYTTNSMVPDSAATAFSMFSGVKTNYYTLGYDSGIKVCSRNQTFLKIVAKLCLAFLHIPLL